MQGSTEGYSWYIHYHGILLLFCLAKVSFWNSGIYSGSQYYFMFRRIVQILDGVYLIANGITWSSLVWYLAL
jgi:hypothetical protein